MKKSGKILFSVLFLIIVVIVSIVGKAYLKQKKDITEGKDLVPVQFLVISQTVSPTSTVSSAPTVSSVSTGATTSLKIYKNEAFGFSFEYPKDYEIAKNGEIEVNKVTDGGISLIDNSRSGKPEMNFLFNPDGLGPVYGDIYYCTKIENDKLKIISRKEYKTSDFTDGDPDPETIDIFFEIGKYQSAKGFDNGILVFFSYDKNGPNYEKELREIIDTMKITKENIYGENTCK